MRRAAALAIRSLVLLLLAGDAAIAQTPPTSPSPTSTALSRAALRIQDKKECTTLAEHRAIARHNRAGFVRQCMADRQGERKAAAKASK